jgi:hypothetical protein
MKSRDTLSGDGTRPKGEKRRDRKGGKEGGERTKMKTERGGRDTVSLGARWGVWS